MPRVVLLLSFALLLSASAAADRYQPSPENLKAREWFQDARFGLFVHWGIYSLLENGEWVLHNTKMTLPEYEKLADRFNPVNYDPAEWVALAKAAGMRYITITSKHHDGFAMFDSKVSDWDIVDRTPYKRDPLQMLAEECRRQGMRLFFYYSQLDWRHPDYFPRGRTGQHTGRPESGDWYRYLDYMDSQIEELLTRYGDIAGIWFDGWWDRKDADWRLDKTYGLIHRLSPATLLGANHHQAPFDGEDFQMWEKDLPGGNTAGFNEEAKIGSLPLETCDTINRSWGYNSKDRNFKSTRELVHYLVRAAGHNANFLLNVGPRPDGSIQPEFVDRLREMGAWLEKNGASIYGTRGGPIPPRRWGVSTRRGKTVYLHLLELEDEVLALPHFADIRSARLLQGGRKIETVRTELGWMLRIPMEARDPIDTVVVLETP